MTIVCGTDFSAAADQAARAAGALAKRFGLPLKLVHVIDELGAEHTVLGPHNVLYDPLRERLRKTAERLGERFGISVEPVVLPGSSHETLLAVAADSHARLIVVASLGESKRHRLLLGSVAERVTRLSPVPVLIVRDASRIEAWIEGRRPLNIVVGAELAPSSRVALWWAVELRWFGRCDITIAEVVWPAGEEARLGMSGPPPADDLAPDLRAVLERELREWTGDLPGDGETTFAIVPGEGRADGHLVRLAEECDADLLVVGTHQRASIAHLWRGSISSGVIRQGAGNIVCVPRGDAMHADQTIPSFRDALIPTDLSPLGNRAIPVGYGLVAAGGLVHLLHVLTGATAEDDASSRAALSALIPPGAAARGIQTEIEVVREADAHAGILQAAARLGVDVICLATQGRSGLSTLILGSEAQRVVRGARQPVLLVPPPFEG